MCTTTSCYDLKFKKKEDNLNIDFDFEKKEKKTNVTYFICFRENYGSGVISFYFLFFSIESHNFILIFLLFNKERIHLVDI